MCIWTFSIVTDYTNAMFQKQTAYVLISDDGKFQVHISGISHVTSLSKDYSVHLKAKCQIERFQIFLKAALICM
jgi:hypothetical protein